MDETLTIETDEGVYTRRVPPATLIPESDDPGTATEDVIRWTTMRWGMPDFIFAPKSVRTGRAVGEIGDAVLYVGGIAAVIQVKARCAPPGDEDRERRWIESKVNTAARQASGTIRKLSQSTHSLSNERGNIVEIDGAATTWVPVVVVDHPDAPEMTPTPEPDAVVLHRRDWEFLFDQLKSSYAVVQYLHRVRRYGAVELGREPLRYYELAAEDAATPPDPIDERFGPTVRRMPAPQLPQKPAGHATEPFHRILRTVMEDLAVCGTRDPEITPHDMLDALAALDQMPVAHRSDIGRTLLGWMEDVSEDEADTVRWRSRVIRSPDAPALLFGTTGKFTRMRQHAFSAFVMLRHTQHRELMADYGTDLTVGVLLTPRRDGLRAWDTTLAAVRGDIEWERGEREAAEEAFALTPAEAGTPWSVPEGRA